MQEINFQVSGEGIRWLDSLRESLEDNIPELDAVIRKTVDKIEVEVTKEIWVVIGDYLAYT